MPGKLETQVARVKKAIQGLSDQLEKLEQTASKVRRVTPDPKGKRGPRDKPAPKAGRAKQAPKAPRVRKAPRG